MKTPALFSLKAAPMLAAAIATMFVSQAAQAATYTWTPTTANTYAWNDASSKWTTGFPNAIGDVANLNINLAGAQTINLSTGITLGTLNLSDSTTGFFTTTLADGTGGSLAFDQFGSANAQLNKTTATNNVNDTISATITLNDNLDLANSSTTATGTLTLSGGITAGTTGTKTITNLGSGTQGIILGGVIGTGSGDVALVQDSLTSALTLNGSAVNTFTGGVNIKRGTLQLDFSNLSAAANLLDSGNALTLGSGILSIKGNASGSTTQGYASLTFNGGGGVLLNPNGGTDTTFEFGSISSVNTVGQSLLVGKTAGTGSGSAVITTTDDKDAQGIYGSRVVYTSDGGTTVDWATTATSASPFVFGTYGTDSGTYDTMVAGATSDSLNDTTGSLNLSGAHTHNTLKITSGATLDISGNSLTLTSGGLLSVGTVASTIQGTDGATRLKGSASGDLVIHQYNTGGLTISAVIGDNGGATALTKTGPGILKLPTACTYTGGIVINGGTVAIGIETALGAAPGSFVANSITLNGGNLQIGIINNRFETIANVNRGVFIGPNGGTVSHGGGGGFRTISGAISGSGTLTFSGMSRMTLNAVNPFSGLMIVGNNLGLYQPELNVGNRLALQYATLNMGTGTFGTAGGAPDVVLGGLTGSTSLDMKTLLFSIGNNNSDTTYNGILSNGKITKIGSGTLTLNGANTYSGQTTVSAGTLLLLGANTTTGKTLISGGTLQLGNLLALQNSPFDPSGAGTLAFSSGINTPTFGGLTGAANLTLPSNITGLTLNPASGAVNTYSGALGSATAGMTLTLNGNAAGKQVLAGNNIFTGATTLTAGTLNLGGAETPGTSGPLGKPATVANSIIFGGGILQYSPANQYDYSGRFTATGNNAYKIDTDGQDVIFASALAASGSSGLTKSGTGTLTLTGANSYTGATTVNGGTLLLDMTGTGALGTSALTLGNGTFSVLGKTSGTTAQTLGNLTLTANTTSKIVLDPNNSEAGSTTLTLGNAWTRNAGSILLIDYSSASSGTRQVKTAGATTGYTLSNGIYGGILVKDTGIVTGFVTGFATRAAGTDQPITRYDDAALATTLAVDSNNSTVNFSTLNSVYTSGILNWTNGGALGSRSVNSLVIDSTTSGGTINLGASSNILTVTSGGILFRGSNPVTLTGGQIGAASSEVILHLVGPGSLTLNSPISSGSGSLTLYGGGGSVVINSNSTYTGTTTISAGSALNIQNTMSLGTSAGGTTVMSGGQLQIQGNIFTLKEALTLNGSGISNDGALRNISGANVWNGAVTLASAARINSDSGILMFQNPDAAINTSGYALTFGGAGDISVLVGISGAGGVTKDGAGTLGIFAAAPTYTGVTTVNGGNILLGVAESAGTSGPLGMQAASAAGTIVFGGGSLRYSPQNNTDYSGRFSTAANQPISIDTYCRDVTFATALTSSGGSLTKLGAGTLTLTSASSTYSGGTTVSGGTLLLSGAGVVPGSGAVTISGGGNLSVADATARTTTVGGLALTNAALTTLDWNAGAVDTLNTTAAATASGNIGLALNLTGTPSGTGLTLLSAASGLTSGGANYFLANNSAYTATLTPSDTAVTVGNYSSKTALTTIYWYGGKLANALNAMALSDGTAGNWSTTAPGTYTATGLVPGSAANVFFNTGELQQNVVPGANMSVNTLTFNDTTPVTIASDGSFLTLNGTGSGTFERHQREPECHG